MLRLATFPTCAPILPWSAARAAWIFFRLTDFWIKKKLNLDSTFAHVYFKLCLLSLMKSKISALTSNPSFRLAIKKLTGVTYSYKRDVRYGPWLYPRIMPAFIVRRLWSQKQSFWISYNEVPLMKSLIHVYRYIFILPCSESRHVIIMIHSTPASW